MKVWMVTGGAATGKSAFCQELLRAVGDGLICHFSCDQAARELWSNPQIVAEIEAALGGDMSADAGNGTMIDRQRVRELVFSDPEMRGRLEAVLHPPILLMLEEAKVAAQKTGSAKVFLAEVPLYYESHQSLPADTVIVVAATRTVQRTRLMEHRNLDAVTCEGLLNAQLPLELKTDKADVVVWNNGSMTILEAQALVLIRDCWQL